MEGGKLPGRAQSPEPGGDKGSKKQPNLEIAKSSKTPEKSGGATPEAGLRRYQSLPASPEYYDVIPEVELASRTSSQTGLRRTASDGDLMSEPTSPTHNRAPSAPDIPVGSILLSIAEQGSTAWMLMPDDDMFGRSTLSPTKSSPGKPKTKGRNSKPKTLGADNKGEMMQQDASEALITARRQETVATRLRETELLGPEGDAADSPRNLDLSFWSQMSNDLDGSGSDVHSPCTAAAGEGLYTPEQPEARQIPAATATATATTRPDRLGTSGPRTAAASAKPVETAQRRARYWGGAPLDWEKAVGIKASPDGRPASDQAEDSDGDEDQPWWANLDDLESESEGSEGRDFQGFAMEHRSEWSSDSSVEVGTVNSYAGTGWPKLGMKIRKTSRDHDEAQGKISSPAPSPTWGSLWPTSSRNSQNGARRGRHQRSYTADYDAPDMYLEPVPGHTLEPTLSTELSDKVRRSVTVGAQGGYAPSNTTGTSPAEAVEASGLSMSALALALSPRREGTGGGGGWGVRSGLDGQRLNAMIQAVAVGGTRDDVLAAAERTPPLESTGKDEEPPPALPTKADDKPGTEVRQDASVLLKILRTSASQSPETLRQLIALAEQPQGAEAIAKEGGLDVVVTVMSSEWANRIVATMCAELLRSLLPGGIAMSRRKLLKRLPQLQAGALSGVGGGLRVDHPVEPAPRDPAGSAPGASTPPRADPGLSEGENSGATKASSVILKKKHLKKLRKRSTTIAWACHALVRVMQRFKTAESVQDKGSSALWGVLSPPNEPQSMAHREIDSYIQRVAAIEILEAGGVFVLINNLTEHAGFANVAYSSVGALLAIAQLGQQGRQAIERQQGKRAIRAAMTEHPAIGYGGRFASLASWLETSDASSADGVGVDRETVCSSSSYTEDLPVGEDGALEERPFKVRTAKRMSLRRLVRAPMLPLGGSAVSDGDDMDLRNVRLSDSAGISPPPKAVEDKLWGRIISAVGRRRDQ